jgi:hypothetical protein
MNPIVEFFVSLIAKLFGVALDQKKKVEPLLPVQIINVIHVDNHQEKQDSRTFPVDNPPSVNEKKESPKLLGNIRPIVLPVPSTTDESKSEEFTDEYFEKLAVDLVEKVRPQDRIILHDKRYPKEQK